MRHAAETHAQRHDRDDGEQHDERRPHHLYVPIEPPARWLQRGEDARGRAAGLCRLLEIHWRFDGRSRRQFGSGERQSGGARRLGPFLEHVRAFAAVGRDVAAARDVDLDRVERALALIILGQQFTQAASLHAHDGIGGRIEVRVLAEHVHRDVEALEALAGELALDQIAEQHARPFRTGKGLAAQYAFEHVSHRGGGGRIFLQASNPRIGTSAATIITRLATPVQSLTGQ